MGSAAHTVCVLLCFGVSGSCYTLQTVGPCTVNRETVRKNNTHTHTHTHWPLLFPEPEQVLLHQEYPVCKHLFPVFGDKRFTQSVRKKKN